MDPQFLHPGELMNAEGFQYQASTSSDNEMVVVVAN
jgi:hypothetical protein